MKIIIDRVVVEQALEAMNEAVFSLYSPYTSETPEEKALYETIAAFRAALEEQAQPVAAERERCAEYLMQQAAECRENSPTRVTLESCAAVLMLGLHDEAEPLGWAVQIGTHSAGRRQGKPRYVLFFNKADAEALADRTRGARPEPFYLEGQPSRTIPVCEATNRQTLLSAINHDPHQ